MTHEEELVSRVTVVLCAKRAVVTDKSLEVETVLGMALNPARVRSDPVFLERAKCRVSILDRITAITRTRGDGAVRVDLGEGLQNVLPASLQVLPAA